ALILILINFAITAPTIELAMVANMWLTHDPSLYLNDLTAFAVMDFVILYCWFRLTSQHHAGVSFRHFLLVPFGCLAVSVLYLHSAYLVLTGTQVNWKGRRYTVNTSKTIQSENASRDPALDPALAQDGSD